jgi:hypothetical protein
MRSWSVLSVPKPPTQDHTTILSLAKRRSKTCSRCTKQKPIVLPLEVGKLENWDSPKFDILDTIVAFSCSCFFQLDRPRHTIFHTMFCSCAAIIDHHRPRGPISPSDVAAFSLAHAPQDFQNDRRDGAEVWSTDLERSQRLKQIPQGFKGFC